MRKRVLTTSLTVINREFFKSTAVKWVCELPRWKEISEPFYLSARKEGNWSCLCLTFLEMSLSILDTAGNPEKVPLQLPLKGMNSSRAEFNVCTPTWDTLWGAKNAHARTFSNACDKIIGGPILILTVIWFYNCK